MSDITPNQEATRLEPRSAQTSERGVDIEDIYRDERLDRPEPQEVSTREAADHLIKRRKEDQAGVDYHDAENYIDQVKWGEQPNRRAHRNDAGASGTLSDTRQLAESLGNYREHRQQLAAEYLQAQYGEGEQGATADNPEQPQLTEQQQIEQRAQEIVNEQIRTQTQAQLEQRLAEIEQARQMQAAHHQAIQDAKLAIERMHAAEFSDIRTYADLAALAQQDPQRHQRYLEILAGYQQAAEQEQRVAAGRQQLAQMDQERQRHQALAWCAEQDSQFERLHPEMRNPAVKEKEQRQVMEYLTKDRGLSPQQIEHLWWNDASFRSANGQATLVAAARYHAAQKRASQVQAKRLPPVQRPGVSRDRAWIDSDRLASLERRLESSGSVRTAAELVRARRAAAR